MMKREVAWRVFAEEYYSSTLIESSVEERSPTYVVSPLGARINRILLAGTLVEVENRSGEEGSGPFVRAVVADPTGHFYLNTGQYNQDAGFALLKMDIPSYIAVVGKVHTYEPEPGQIRKYIRPEIVKEVDENTRNRWIVETAEFTKERIEAMKEALAMEEPSEETLIAIGIPERVAVGAVKAVKHYGDVNINKYINIIIDSLRYVLSEGKHRLRGEEKTTENYEIKELIDSVAKGDDVYWEDIKNAAAERGIPMKSVEEEIERMIRQGILFERKMGELLRIDRDEW